MYWKLFLTFVKIGMFTIGGGFAMIPLIEREIIGRGWIDKKDFIDLLALSQSLPGVFAVNIAIFIGYKLKKITGSIFCALGTILPSFCIILIIAVFFNRFQDNIWVIKIFNGIRPAVVALILVPCLNLAKSANLNKGKWIIPIICALGIWICGISPIYFVMAGGAGGVIYGLWLKDKLKKHNR